jgi:hypothetical protein
LKEAYEWFHSSVLDWFWNANIYHMIEAENWLNLELSDYYWKNVYFRKKLSFSLSKSKPRSWLSLYIYIIICEDQFGHLQWTWWSWTLNDSIIMFCSIIFHFKCIEIFRVRFLSGTIFLITSRPNSILPGSIFPRNQRIIPSLKSNSLQNITYMTHLYSTAAVNDHLENDLHIWYIHSMSHQAHLST